MKDRASSRMDLVAAIRTGIALAVLYTVILAVAALLFTAIVFAVAMVKHV